ncbi:ubiquinol-cytochrome-c reductase complex assembly factor 1 [Momordica charantia]|uniref:Ubiquinol-cytochrome-c reductase complex assembly factor 1 n=1 Tax=Momordica charantia TaxID=3673 RepID=A0A6J1BVJ3_MOMCH|nr:ubiquinol-cytochrome-c reductase complex assembly factor 1 [Momordica charantia]
MLAKWSRATRHLWRLGAESNLKFSTDLRVCPHRCYAKVAAAVAPNIGHLEKGILGGHVVQLDKLFLSKPFSLALATDSPLRMDEPQYEGIKRLFLKLMMFYSKQSKHIRGANVIYRRIVSQVEKPAIYDVFNLEKTFKTTFSLLVLHTWLCLRRLKEEGKEGVERGQYLYEIYNHDVELRVSKAGVNLLLTRWMKDLEKIFYGNIVAYDSAMLPEAGQDELQNVIWRNIYSEDGSPLPNDAAALRAVQAMARYTRREVSCLSLTDKEAIFSGNFMFTPLETGKPSSKVGR